jgi:hypothetical protein
MLREVPLTILKQLGGYRFQAMTGARDFVGSEKELWFRVSGKDTVTDRHVNRVMIRLEADDLYTVQTFFIGGLTQRVVCDSRNCPVQNLRETFIRLTGLETSL